MKTKFLHILACLLLILTAGCKKDDPASSPDADRRIVNLSLGITSRADAVGSEDKPDVLHLWIFNGNEGENNACLYYTKIDYPSFSGFDIQGNPVHTVDVTLNNLQNGTNLKFYVVLNKPYQEASKEIVFDANTTLASLESQQFVLTGYAGDNKVPMSGTAEVTITATNSDYSVTIPAKRAVAKLDVFVTKNNPNSNVSVSDIQLFKEPDKGILFENTNPGYTVSSNGRSLLAGTTPVNIGTYITEAESSVEDLHLYEGSDKLTQLEFTNSYLLENLDGDDNIYLDDNTIIDDRYYIELDYTLGTESLNKKIYLRKIERNTWNKLFIRIKDGGISIHWYVVDWEDGGTLTIDEGMHPSTNFTNYSGVEINQNTWYVANMNTSSPDWMTNAARYTFEMRTNHQWNMTCSNVTDFDYKIFKLQDGSYIDITTNQDQSVRTQGTYAICVYPKNPLEDPAQTCNISFSYYNTYMQDWYVLPDNAAKATITQVSATNN